MRPIKLLWEEAGARLMAYGLSMAAMGEVSHPGTTRRPTKDRRSVSPRSQRDETAQPDERAVPQVGRVLRRAREHQQLSLRDVERRIGRSNAYLSQVERGVVRRPDPLILLELANLYHLNFPTLAGWAGWSEGQTERGGQFATEALRDLLRLVLQLSDAQRAELLAHAEGLIREERS